MGSSVSHSAPPAPVIPSAAGAAPPADSKEEAKEEKVDWLNLPCPVPYEEIQREALMSLKPELFEGMRFDFTKGLNPKFSLSHSVFMGSAEIPSQSSDTIKVPTAHYEFGANFLDPKLMLVGRILTDGRLNARVKCDLTENLTLKVNAQLQNEPHFSQGTFNFDYKGKDFRSQFQMGNSAFYGINYIQHVQTGSSKLSFTLDHFHGGSVFRLTYLWSERLDAKPFPKSYSVNTFQSIQFSRSISWRDNVNTELTLK